MDYKKLLNDEQYNAVVCTDGPIMVSAGAGSGKTRVLTYHIAYLITERRVLPFNILAITFTNKAANEMKERIVKIEPGGNLVSVSTIHSFCVRMLRQYASFLNGYKENFTIYSDSDSAKIQRDIFKSMKIDDESVKNKFKSYLSTIKNDNMSVDEFIKINRYDTNMAEFKIFADSYADELRKNNAMDFDDLLVNFYLLIANNKEVLASIQNRYHYFSVDEFQDINTIQYDIIKLLASKTRNILVVGDEDQLIYGWRGANINNIANFMHDFPECKIFKLEQNYRSTKKILERANEIIKNNKNRLDKKLYTDNDEGSEVSYYNAINETDEADFVVRTIIKKHNEGLAYHDMAILMRVNSLSRTFEEKLLAYNIPHIIYHGFKFFERAEIKNVLAYLMAIVNPDDDVSFERIINFPKRGIGDASIDKLKLIAIKNQTNLKNVVMNYENEILPNPLKDKLKAIKSIFTDLETKINELTMYDFFSYMLDRCDILKSFDLDNESEYERYLNINSLSSSVKEFEENNDGATILDYLESVTLSSAIDNDDGNGVVIATIHGAKGLEFDTVFVVGCEERIFPISRDEGEDLEEERRLMYVAVTRAKRELYLTSASSRFLYGKRDYSAKSRFIREMGLDKQIKTTPTTYNNYNNRIGGYDMKTLQSNNNITQNYTFSKSTIEKKSVDFSRIKLGAKVIHPKFGEGEITEITPNSANHCVKIKFEGVGEKMLSLEYAPIEFKD